MQRCAVCKKSVEVMGFECKCGSRFCLKHRLPEAHACAHDHKTEARRHLAEQNPRVVAEKVVEV